MSPLHCASSYRKPPQTASPPHSTASIWSPMPRTDGCGPTHLLCNSVDNHQVGPKIPAGGGRGFPAAQGSGEEVAASLEELPVPGTGPAQASCRASTELSGRVLFSPLSWTLESRAGLPFQLINSLLPKPRPQSLCLSGRPSKWMPIPLTTPQLCPTQAREPHPVRH